jgi:hypothetical protein
MANWLHVTYTEQVRLWYILPSPEITKIKRVGKVMACEQPMNKRNISPQSVKVVIEDPKTKDVVISHCDPVVKTIVLDTPFSREGIGDED